ncbi:MAG: transcription antitermination factor NusB [Rhodospirillales bacterium]|nr:transcription antitermination factor NusB [Rhodospirillales bacterium]
MTPAARPSFRERRSAARLAAVQALYALEVSGDPAERVISDFVERRWSSVDQTKPGTPPDRAFLQGLVEGVVARRGEIDVAVGAALSQGWTMDRLEILLQAILRSGAYELAAQPDVPVGVVINEYVEIAHEFFSGKEPGLVNAVLDRIAAQMRAGTQDVPSGAGHGGT